MFDFFVFFTPFVVRTQIVIMRHSIFMLARRDVMDSGFVLVAAVTFGILATAWGIVIVLMLIGFAEVRRGALGGGRGLGGLRARSTRNVGARNA